MPNFKVKHHLKRLLVTILLTKLKLVLTQGYIGIIFVTQVLTVSFLLQKLKIQLER